MAKKVNQKYKTSNYYWIFILFGMGILITGIGFYHLYYKPHIIRYKKFGINFPSGNYIHGIDVSKYQKTIDWAEVDSMNIEGINIDFAFLKASEGVTLKDKQFDYNWNKIKDTNLKRGAYHFFRANKDANIQADLFLKTVNFKKGDIVPVLDIETTDGQSPEEIEQKALIFLQNIESKLNVKPIIYTNISFYNSYLYKDKFLEYPLWIAHYNEPEQPRIDRKWSFWQHSDHGRVNSIVGDVDFNVFNGSIDDLDSLCIR